MTVDRIKFLLLQGEMTQKDMAEKVGVTPATINNISKTGKCSRKSFVRILNAFDIEPEDLLPDGFER